MRPLTYSIYSFFGDVLFYLPVFHFQKLDAGGAMGASKSYSI